MVSTLYQSKTVIRIGLARSTNMLCRYNIRFLHLRDLCFAVFYSYRIEDGGWRKEVKGLLAEDIYAFTVAVEISNISFFKTIGIP